MRRLIVADTITEIHSCGTYGRRRVRAALLAEYDVNVNHKLVNSIMAEHGLIGVDTPVELVKMSPIRAADPFGKSSRHGSVMALSYRDP